MTPESFALWLAAMKAAGLARSDVACARLLRVSANAMLDFKRRGTDHRTALACRALLHRLDPWA